MAQFVKTFVPSEMRIVLASGDEFDLSGADRVVLEAGTLEICYPRTAAHPDLMISPPRTAAHPDLMISPPRTIYLSSSEWRQIISTAPTREVQIAEGVERKRLETIESLEDQLSSLETDPGSNATMIAAFTKMIAKLKHEA